MDQGSRHITPDLREPRKYRCATERPQSRMMVTNDQPWSAQLEEAAVELTEVGVYAAVQNLFQRGLVVVVGSGASCSYGLPGMPELADHLLVAVPHRLAELGREAQEVWGRVGRSLAAGEGLEATLVDGVPEDLADMLTNLIAGRISESEEQAIAKILADREVSAFGRLFAHALRVAPSIDVVTTNYDRLIEVHAARAGLPVDTMYFGHTVGRLDQKRSHDEVLRGQTVVGRPQRTMITTWPHLRLSKPHGSLDWFAQGDEHYRSDLAIPGSRRIIAPGGNKYRLGYDAPFDAQRERANQAIDQSSALLFVGYGFNDEHLQTHIRSRFAQVPAIILTRNLSPSARNYLATNRSAIGIEATADGCVVWQGNMELRLEIALWELETLVKEVLGI